MTTPTDSYPAFDEAATLETIISEVEAPPTATRGEATHAGYIPGTLDYSSGLVASALPPAQRAAVEASLRSLPADTPAAIRSQIEADFVRRTLEASTANRREMRNVLETGSAVGKELVEIAHQTGTLHREVSDLEARLAEVSHFDEITGQPVLRLDGKRRTAIEFELKLKRMHIAHLSPGGGEFDIRMGRAKAKELEARRKAHEAAAVQWEANRRADEILRDEQIEKRARALANSRRTDLASSAF